MTYKFKMLKTLFFTLQGAPSSGKLLQLWKVHSAFARHMEGKTFVPDREEFDLDHWSERWITIIEGNCEIHTLTAIKSSRQRAFIWMMLYYSKWKYEEKLQNLQTKHMITSDLKSRC